MYFKISRDLTEIQKESSVTARSCQSQQTRLRFEKPTNIMARSQQSLRDGGNLATISPRFRNSQTSWRDLYKSSRDGGYLTAISLGFKISQMSQRDLNKSRRDLGKLVEMEDISPRSRRDLESRKHHGEISSDYSEDSPAEGLQNQNKKKTDMTKQRHTKLTFQV